MKKFLSIVGIMLVVVFCSSLFLIFKNDDFYGSDNYFSSSSNLSTEITMDFSDKTYLAFGDSITFGTDVLNNYAQMNDPYPELVSNNLGLKSFYNYGQSGATLCANDLGLKCISNNVVNCTEKYDIVSVLGGVNDYNRALPLGTILCDDNTTIYGSLNVIARHLTEFYSTSFVFFMTPYKENYNGVHWSTNNTQGYNLQAVAIAIKEVANNYNIPVLDLFEKGEFEKEMYNSGDGLHPSQEFIRNYTAPQIAQFIKENYSK